MLIRFAKLAGGLRLLIATTAPLVVSSSALLSARTVAYLVGFTLGSIGAGWLAIVATLVAVTGFWGAGANTAECEAYRAQMRGIDAANRAAMANYQLAYKSYVDGPYQNYLLAAQALALSASQKSKAICANQLESRSCISCGGGGWLGPTCNYSTCYPRRDCEQEQFAKFNTGLTAPISPVLPLLQTYPACSSPDCPPGKKVWVQVLWGSPSGNFVDSKGCFIVAYSQDAPTLPPTLEYNPFLPKAFVQSRAISYYLVDGDRFRGLNDKDWKNLESVAGWDKGYWKAEQTDSECRGWRPGWSRKVK